MDKIFTKPHHSIAHSDSAGGLPRISFLSSGSGMPIRTIALDEQVAARHIEVESASLSNPELSDKRKAGGFEQTASNLLNCGFTLEVLEASERAETRRSTAPTNKGRQGPKVLAASGAHSYDRRSIARFATVAPSSPLAIVEHGNAELPATAIAGLYYKSQVLSTSGTCAHPRSEGNGYYKTLAAVDASFGGTVGGLLPPTFSSTGLAERRVPILGIGKPPLFFTTVNACTNLEFNQERDLRHRLREMARVARALIRRERPAYFTTKGVAPA